MNYSFSFPRLWQLILKQGMENARFYLLYALATFGVSALAVSLWLFMEGSHYEEQGLYQASLIALYLCGSLFASLQFEPLSRKDKGVYWLSFPASHIEKLVCAVFYTFVVFNVLFIACFLLSRWLAVSYITLYVIPDGGSWTALELSFFQTSQFYFIHIFIALQAFYLLGSVYFSRYSFVKTTVMITALTFGFILYMQILLKYTLGSDYIFNHGPAIREIMPEKLDGINFYKVYSLPAWVLGTVSWLLKYSWAPVFWIITWKRLAEKEI